VPGTDKRHETIQAALVHLRMPLYDGGASSSAVRQTRSQLQAKTAQVDDASRNAEEGATSAWYQWEATSRVVGHYADALAAAKDFETTVRAQTKLGDKAVSDLLTAEGQTLEAYAALQQAHRDQIVAAYTLLASTGQMNAKSLGLATKMFDPEVHYKQIRFHLY
jgi:outer membrane protein TolC